MSNPESNNIKQIFDDISQLINDSIQLEPKINNCINIIIECLKKDKKIILFGNGGSAADAQHIAAEFVGRFNLERKSYAAIALTTDSSIITSIGNDYSFVQIFSRQCESLVTKDDVVIGISTSGNSINVKNGLITAKKNGAKTIGLLGNGGGEIKSIVDYPVIVESNSTARIQEIHRIISHIICDLVEKKMGE
jgi:D-sedoheptulose 7-phosphate isomerase|tara:strand:+ start:1672 stop:2250 length:579 start_codon:yes stop_codon:yes gene_type:complete